jgi:hypothetical protein
LALATATKAKVRITSRPIIRDHVVVVARAVARVVSIVIDVRADGLGGCFNSCPASCEGLIRCDCMPSSFLVVVSFFEVVFLTVVALQRISLMFLWKIKSRERSGSKSQSPNQ